MNFNNKTNVENTEKNSCGKLWFACLFHQLCKFCSWGSGACWFSLIKTCAIFIWRTSDWSITINKQPSSNYKYIAFGLHPHHTLLFRKNRVLQYPWRQGYNDFKCLTTAVQWVPLPISYPWGSDLNTRAQKSLHWPEAALGLMPGQCVGSCKKISSYHDFPIYC
jgi:hypothetical protein